MNLIEISDNKKFMKALLIDNLFDSFFLEEAKITTYNTFLIDGHIQEKFYQSLDETEVPEQPDAFSLWGKIKPFCFDIIKGKRLPLQFKIVLHAPHAITTELLNHPDCTLDAGILKALVLTVNYNGTNTTCVTATAMHTFVTDKSIEALWDKRINDFITSIIENAE